MKTDFQSMVLHQDKSVRIISNAVFHWAAGTLVINACFTIIQWIYH